MKNSRFTETQIIAILKEQEQDLKVVDICHKYGIISKISKQEKQYAGILYRGKIIN